MRDGFHNVTCLLGQGVEAECFPGAVLVVGYHGELVYEEAVGQATLVPSARRMTVETIFDLASLTKPIATTTALMLLLEAGMIRLDAPIDTYLDTRFRLAGDVPTIQHLLSHCAGLPAWRPYYQAVELRAPALDRRRAIYAAVHRESLIFPPGTMVQYSDAGFMLLGELVEAVTATPLATFCRQKIFAALHLEDMAFRDLEQPRTPAGQFASTEYCLWRRRILDGEVHDENAWAMGGVAGHAGLFGTGRHVWRFAQSLLNGLQGLAWLVSTPTARTFTTRQGVPEGSTWALGWDTPTPGKSSAGQYFSPTAIGHLGFTGTSLWIDPTEQVVVVLLTNRVHPSRQREGMRTFRPLIHDAVMRALQVG